MVEVKLTPQNVQVQESVDECAYRTGCFGERPNNKAESPIDEIYTLDESRIVSVSATKINKLRTPK